LTSSVERLRDDGAQVLLVDVTRNGGGSEWAEVAARIMSPVSLRSAPVGILRSAAGARRWQELADKLSKEARRAQNADKALLTDFAKQAEVIASGVRPCVGAPCSRLAMAGYGSGLIAQLPAGRLSGRAWGADIFSPAQFSYRDGLWNGPVIVLVDSETWSAAEQFTALLRDNDAAIVMGTRTGGAGCGHLDGNDPVILAHSGAMLELPNCARFRKDGSNEVNGIVPDIVTGVRWNDGTAFAGHLTASRLPEAVALASRQSR
jgi:Peptidase family S41